MKLAFLWIGRTRDRRLADLIGEYVERIGRYCRIEITELRDPPRGRAADTRLRVETEGKMILGRLKPGQVRVALDERGKEMTSERFAAELGRTLQGAPAGVAMILGGPYGLSEAVRREAGHVWSLSRMTLTHEMARLVAVDQVYRAFTILRGEKYHH